MSEPFIGQIIMFGGSFAPRNWAFCDGALLDVGQYPALFSIISTTYGGNGRTTFALPDLRGRTPLSPGAGPGLSTYVRGQIGGAEGVTLTEVQIPSHGHSGGTGRLQASSGAPNTTDPTGGVLGAAAIYSDQPATLNLAASSVSGAATGSSGGGQAHPNLQPFLAVNFIIALVGTFPPRN